MEISWWNWCWDNSYIAPEFRCPTYSWPDTLEEYMKINEPENYAMQHDMAVYNYIVSGVYFISVLMILISFLVLIYRVIQKIIKKENYKLNYIFPIILMVTWIILIILWFMFTQYYSFYLNSSKI